MPIVKYGTTPKTHGLVEICFTADVSVVMDSNLAGIPPGMATLSLADAGMGTG